MKTLFAAAVLAALPLSACVTTETSEQPTIFDMTSGAYFGETIKSTTGHPAAFGSAFGVVSKSVAQCKRSRECYWRALNGGEFHMDETTGRQYFIDPKRGDSWWENGDFRGYGPDSL